MLDYELKPHISVMGGIASFEARETENHDDYGKCGLQKVTRYSCGMHGSRSALMRPVMFPYLKGELILLCFRRTAGAWSTSGQ